MKHYVYYLISSIDGKVFYIGKGSGNRMLKHLEIANGNSQAKSKNPHLYSKINTITKNGGNVICTKVFETNNEDLAYKKEKLYIEQIGLENLTNITNGGLGGLIGEWTDSRKKKLRETKSKCDGKPKGFHGKHTDETKQKISESLKKKNLKGYWKGKSLSEETKQKMRESGKGKNAGPISEKRRQSIIDGIARKKSKG